jgi:hypothetical protein
VLRNVNILWVIACVNAKKTTAYPIQAARTSACSATVTIGTGASLDDSNFTLLVG